MKYEELTCLDLDLDQHWYQRWYHSPCSLVAVGLYEPRLPGTHGASPMWARTRPTVTATVLAGPQTKRSEKARRSISTMSAPEGGGGGAMGMGVGREQQQYKAPTATPQTASATTAMVTVAVAVEALAALEEHVENERT
jgi:hypothetical protein